MSLTGLFIHDVRNLESMRVFKLRVRGIDSDAERDSKVKTL